MADAYWRLFIAWLWKEPFMAAISVLLSGIGRQ
jgi:hypothetical protein